MYSFRAIERFFHAFLSLLVFESGSVVILTPPPPTRAEVAETAIRAKVKPIPGRLKGSVCGRGPRPSIKILKTKQHTDQQDAFWAMNKWGQIDVLKGMHYCTCIRVDILEPV